MEVLAACAPLVKSRLPGVGTKSRYTPWLPLDAFGPDDGCGGDEFQVWGEE